MIKSSSSESVGFSPVSRWDVSILILGSLPSVESLKQQQYYAKKQNSFWKIMGSLVGAGMELPYEDRLSALLDHRIALWDVCKAATRQGSLDSKIQDPQLNDFLAFLNEHKKIKKICFNGRYAEKLYRKHVLLTLPEPMQALPLLSLPSTSSAYASMRFEEKLSCWQNIL